VFLLSLKKNTQQKQQAGQKAATVREMLGGKSEINPNDDDEHH